MGDQKDTIAKDVEGRSISNTKSVCSLAVEVEMHPPAPSSMGEREMNLTEAHQHPSATKERGLEERPSRPFHYVNKLDTLSVYMMDSGLPHETFMPRDLRMRRR